MSEDTDVLIVGAGHGGLAVAHELVRAGRDVTLVDAHARVGDAWRGRWDSLRLFTPRELDALPGIPFTAGADPFPNKDEVADYQERYAKEMRFDLRLGAGVTALRPRREAFEVTLGTTEIRARSVVIASGQFDAPAIPDFAARLDPAVLQLHSREYRRAADLPEGPVAVIGAANSGGEIAVEVARTRPTTIAVGTRRPLPPRRWRSPAWWRLALWRDRLFHERTAYVSWLPWPLRAGGYLEADLDRAAATHGLHLARRAVAASGDTVRFADGASVSGLRTVIWATGYRADHSWIDAPKENGVIRIGRHGRTAVERLHFVRGRFLFAISRHARDVARDVSRSA
ncbi:MAG TPA: NAD(P)/FAD-dependent oxidoreductase [Candidatus Limnocylindria bacterium]|nr:NAD(P)/FAD-dependent oxidoreductase [Candidatus Limnocylindria bacterium]